MALMIIGYLLFSVALGEIGAMWTNVYVKHLKVEKLI